VEAKLAKADAFDGKTDKIVSKCPSCKLQMDGKSEFAAQVSGYTLHFCSEKCKGEFTKDTTKSIKELVIPGN
jgi:YHS domain-containing protein